MFCCGFYSFRILSVLLSFVAFATSGAVRAADCAWLFGLAPRSTIKGLPGPINDSEKDSLQIDALGRGFLPVDLLTRAEIRGGSPHSSPNEAWIRDRYPLQTRDSDGRLVMIPYLNAREGRGNPGSVSEYVPVAPPEGAPRDAKAYRIQGKIHWMRSRNLPLVLEGGNFLSIGGSAILGNRVLQENGLTSWEWSRRLGGTAEANRIAGNLSASGYFRRNEAEVIAVLERTFETGSGRVLILPWMPGERTGHVDMYLTALGPSTLAVAEIPARMIQETAGGEERIYLERLNGWLNERATQLTQHFAANGASVKVVRIPMLPPRNLTRSGMSEYGWDGDFLASANLVIQNGHAWVPHFPTVLSRYSSEAQAEFNSVTDALFSEHGLALERRDAEALIPHHGYFHCLTADLALP